MQSEQIILQVKNLTKSFQNSDGTEVIAVNKVSFDLYSGEILGIVGESGSGKSTLVRLLTRMLMPTEGEIRCQGKEITKLKGRELRQLYQKMQMVFQMPKESFDPRQTLGEGIGESLKNQGWDKAKRKERVEELLVKCGLPADYYDRYPHEVSGGQCQRAAIARALSIHPSILICDEATSALDVTVQRQIIELLQEIKKQQDLTILFICHDLALVQAFCDRVLVMQEGRVVEEGLVDSILDHPAEEYTKSLIWGIQAE